jgi:hypothetical protein
MNAQWTKLNLLTPFDTATFKETKAALYQSSISLFVGVVKAFNNKQVMK